MSRLSGQVAQPVWVFSQDRALAWADTVVELALRKMANTLFTVSPTVTSIPFSVVPAPKGSGVAHYRAIRAMA